MDLDLIQWCPECKRPQLFAEVKSSFVSRREWEQTRRHASYYGHGCLAILVIEGQDAIGTVVYDSADDSISEAPRAGEQYLTSVLERARDIHVCWLRWLVSGTRIASGLGPAFIVLAGRRAVMAARISAGMTRIVIGGALSECMAVPGRASR